ncbi:hypothetical protein L4Z64_001489 [Pseudomonas aeruginosa]|nr:hypothetical protein [Pseudomonas aeruginosa]
MKLIYTAALLLIATFAQAADKSGVLPIDVYPPKGDGDGSLWKVSFTPSYLDEAGESVTQPTVSLSVRSGSCGYGATNIVKMRSGFSVKVSQKVCVGSVNGKNVIVGWLVAPGATPKPMIGADATEYGTGIRYVFQGDYLEAGQSIYTFKAEKQPSPSLSKR